MFSTNLNNTSKMYEFISENEIRAVQAYTHYTKLLLRNFIIISVLLGLV